MCELRLRIDSVFPQPIAYARAMRSTSTQQGGWISRLFGGAEAPAPNANETPVPEGFSRITEFSPDDIFIAGYPKSGNTWVQGLIAGAIYGLDLRLAPDSLVQDLVPDVHFKKIYRRYQSPVFFKTHALPQPEYRRVIYLLRDGRDVMVSYFHHLEALQGGAVDFLRMVQTGEGLFPCKWAEHVRQWLANPHRSSMLIVRYEDLKQNAAKELLRICEFAGLPRDAAVLETAVEKASFASMQQREKQFGWANQAWPKEKAFVRRGQVGSHVDEMPPDAREAFLKEAGTVLEQAGYC